MNMKVVCEKPFGSPQNQKYSGDFYLSRLFLYGALSSGDVRTQLQRIIMS